MVISDVSELARRVNLDADCSARVGSLAAGEAVVWPWSEELGWIGTGYGFHLEPHQDNRIDLKLRANSISGVVLAEGHPAPAVAVKLEYVEPDEIPAELERATNARGEFAFFDLDPGQWRVSVAKSPRGARVVDLAIEQDIRIELETK
jgi:hypothetical protein